MNVNVHVKHTNEQSEDRVASGADVSSHVAAIRWLNQDWLEFKCGTDAGAFQSVQCQNVLAAMKLCGMDVGDTISPASVKLYPPTKIEEPEKLIPLKDYIRSDRCNLFCGLLGGGLTFAASLNSHSENSTKNAAASAVAAMTVFSTCSALCGALNSSSVDHRAVGSSYQLKGSYVKHVQDEAAAKQFIQHLKDAQS